MTTPTPSGDALSLGWGAPFVLLLLAIAVLPLRAAHWWESNRNKLILSALLGLPVILLYLARDPAALWHTGLEYFSFVVVLLALYSVSGGILLTGDLRATPAVNTAFLAAGALLASFMGTTGASMLLLRPLLATNAERTQVRHTVIFFIFIVANAGGLLTPLGDPPLFMGYLRGVPFTWTLQLWPAWLFMNASLLVLYFIFDTQALMREPQAALIRDRLLQKPLRLAGTGHLITLAGVLACVAGLAFPWREAGLIGLALLSLWRTPPEIHRANHFSWHPMVEVAALFAGIFATMVPALEILRERGPTLGVVEPWQYFWATGLLSSFLDNAPTYLTFFALAEGLGQPSTVPGIGVPEPLLVAISLGAVLMGANTYIGNAPNFMVKAMAEARGVRMPSFFGYMVYSGLVLLPLFGILSLLYFRG